MLAEDGKLDVAEKAQTPLDAVAASGSARAAGTLPDGEALQTHRIALLEDLGIGDAGIGHVAVHGVGAVEAGPAPVPPQTVS